jgi:alkanesulfonate monooxygenase SsuD/methylene tetrahydromethanopterin reductase-like flavin-dependent oxidoreductase (luciferase family)
MKVGLFITNQQTLDTDMVSALDDQFAMVRLARDCGWDSLFSGQHYLNEGNNKQLQTVPLLARLAAEAGEMTIGLGILLLNLHNPVYTAETVATLDIIARGNFVFGVGLGYRDIEFDAFGVPKGERVKRLEEYLTLVERLWTEDRVSYEGPGCRLDNVHMNIRPVQKPRPPIWMAANSDPAVKRAARMADAWFINPHATSDTIRRQMGGLPRGAGCRRKGRAAGVAGHQGGLLRQGSGDRTRNGRTLPAGEIPGLCQVGAG